MNTIEKKLAHRLASSPVINSEMAMRSLCYERAAYHPLTYLACPYSHKKASVRKARFLAATKATKYLMESEGLNVFSPITHSHPLHEIGMRGDWEFWKKVDIEYLRLSEKLVVLMADGWLESVGVQAEIKIALSMGIPVEYLKMGIGE